MKFNTIKPSVGINLKNKVSSALKSHCDTLNNSKNDKNKLVLALAGLGILMKTSIKNIKNDDKKISATEAVDKTNNYYMRKLGFRQYSSNGSLGAILRDFQKGKDFSGHHQEFLDDIESVLDGKMPHGYPLSRILLDNILEERADENLEQFIRNAFGGYKKVSLNELEQPQKDCAIKFFTDLKNISLEEFREKSKKVMLDDVNELYSCMSENLDFLEKDNHSYRGINNYNDNYFNFLNNLKVGETVIPDYGGMFCSGDIRNAMQYAGKEGILFHIILPKGAKVPEVIGFGESVLPPMAEYKVTGIKQAEEGPKIIELEYLPNQGVKKL